MGITFEVLGPGGVPPAVERLRERLGWAGGGAGTSDAFDERAVHVVAWDGAGGAVGAARLAADSSLGFPFERHWPRLLEDLRIPRESLIEVSGVLLDRRRARRILVSAGTGPGPAEAIAGGRRTSELFLGLYRETVQAAFRMRKAAWCTVMDDSRWRLLNRLGLISYPYGERKALGDVVRPYWNDLASMAQRWAMGRPEAYRFFLDGLEPQFRPALQGAPAYA